MDLNVNLILNNTIILILDLISLYRYFVKYKDVLIPRRCVPRYYRIKYYALNALFFTQLSKKKNTYVNNL